MKRKGYCHECGSGIRAELHKPCPNCGSDDWEPKEIVLDGKRIPLEREG